MTRIRDFGLLEVVEETVPVTVTVTVILYGHVFKNYDRTGANSHEAPQNLINIVKRIVAQPPRWRNRSTLADWRHAASRAPSDAGHARWAGPAVARTVTESLISGLCCSAAPACPALPRREPPGPRTNPTVELAPPASHPQGRGGCDFCSLPQVAARAPHRQTQVVRPGHGPGKSVCQ